MGHKQTSLKRIRALAVAIAMGITALALQGLWTGQAFFQYSAWGLTVFALIFLTVMIARVVRERDEEP